MRWWDRAARIAWELEELTRAGYRYEQPDDTAGAFTLVVYATLNNEEVRLEVDFPDLYPYFRFEARAPSLDLPHHQNPLTKNLCLMPRGTDHWHMRYSLADHLSEQLPKTIAAGTAMRHEDVLTVEDHQAEPITTYYESYDEAMILIDSDWTLPNDFTTGEITLTCDLRDKHADPLRGVVTEIRTANGEILFTAPDHLQREGQILHGSIVKLATPHVEANPANFAARLRSTHHLKWHGRTGVLAVVMPEEHAWRQNDGQGWVFIISDKNRGTSYVARAGRAGATDLRARAPELDDLASHTIAVFGLGCNGGISAVELAKAGARELRLIDHDYLDPGTLLRWYLGLPVAGRRKASVLAEFITKHYPLTNVVPYVSRVGADTLVTIEQITAGTSLIYDATAEPGVSYFLAELARHRGVPYLHVSATQGGWGGVIVRLTEHTGCWYCFQAAQTQGRISPAPADKSGTVQPTGCSDPTFTGANFDLATIALAGVRAAVSTLSTHYPTQPWDATTISLRDDNGHLIPPRYETFNLPKDPTCPVCGSTPTRETRC